MKVSTVEKLIRENADTGKGYLNNIQQINSICLNFLKEEFYEENEAGIFQEYLWATLENVPEKYLLAFANHYGGNLVTGIKQNLTEMFKSKKVLFEDKELSVESLTFNMLALKKRQMMYTLWDDKEIYEYLLDFNNKSIEINNRITVEIKSFEGDQSGNYSPYIMLILKDSLLEEIISEMKIQNKNPISYNAWDNSKKYNFLLNLKEKEIDRDKYKIKIEIISGSGYGMGEEPGEAKVYLLMKL